MVGPFFKFGLKKIYGFIKLFLVYSLQGSCLPLEYPVPTGLFSGLLGSTWAVLAGLWPGRTGCVRFWSVPGRREASRAGQRERASN